MSADEILILIMGNMTILRTFLFTLSIFLFPSNALTQTVAVQNGQERGHGWMFAEKGACYLVLPRHLAEPVGRLRLRTSAPIAEGTAFGRAPFWEGIDLAVATVKPSLQPRCTGALDDLIVPDAQRGASVAQLERLNSAGEIERTTLRIGDRDYLTFAGTVASDSRIGRGTSGAFAFSGASPLGMAVTSDEESQATFIRSGEIHIHLRRWLSEYERRFVPAAAEPEAVAPQVVDSHPITFERATQPALADEYGGSNMETAEGIFVAQPDGGLMMRFRLGENGRAVPLSQVLVTSPVGTGYAIPRNILIRFSALPDGRSMKTHFRGQMGLDGALQSRPTAPQNARVLEVHVFSVWGAGPVTIGQIQVR